MLVVRAAAPESPLSEPPPALHFLPVQLAAGAAGLIEHLLVQYIAGAAAASDFCGNWPYVASCFRLLVGKMAEFIASWQPLMS